MKLEEALPLLREGKNIRHPTFEEDVYLMGCYMGMIGEKKINKDPKMFSIVLMRGENMHEDEPFGRGIDSMLIPGTLIFKEEFFKKPCKHGYTTQISILLLTMDNWELYDKE
jgi:hypothetical protein